MIGSPFMSSGASPHSSSSTVMTLERHAYNGRMFARVLEDPKTVWAEHAGFWDLFVPIVMKGRVAAVLVTGPVAKQRPTAAGVALRWQELTGRHAHTADPEFLRYLGATLSVLVLEGKQVRAFERLASCFALLASGRGKADQVANEWERVRTDLERLRFVENTWEAYARWSISGPRTGGQASSGRTRLASSGCRRCPKACSSVSR